MAFIKIITLPSGVSTCSGYFYRPYNGDVSVKRKIVIGEIAEVPDKELEAHLRTGMVMQVPSADFVEDKPKRVRRTREQIESDARAEQEILSMQR